MRNRKFFLIISIAFLSNAQIKVNINSGNPAYPFPQFLPYKNKTTTLVNLATNNPEGVTHAEMEKNIRDAYQIMMNRAKKPGGGVGGIDYIKFESNPDCSEGDGYALLAAVAMADKTTFDGLWLWIHDNAMNKVKRYKDCKESSPGYLYSRLPGWQNVAGTNSAADGDFDIALALVLAYYQWGEYMGINDACGNPISYKQEAIEFLKGLTDTLTFVSSGSTLISGDVGLDGYFKGGDTWTELTDWANDTRRSGFTKPPNFKGPSEQHIDYTAPAYFHQFAEFLASIDSVEYAWNIYQFRRAAASSDWLMGQFLKNPRYIPFAGWVSLSSNNEATFRKFNEGEDFRLPWRTILNYIWHGNPDYTWDPVKHQFIMGQPNTYERDIGLRYAKFLWDNRQEPWKNGCVSGANKTFSYWGPAVLWTNWDIDGSNGNFFFLNWIHGTGSPSAVASQDFQLMSEMYRQLEIEWDVVEPGDGYITSVPQYFHGWFRLLGLLVLTGNYPAPDMIKPSANMKVYLAIDKTFAFEKDTITYTIDYRNYGSVEAKDVKIVDTLHPDFSFVSATGGGVYDNVSHTVKWNIGNIPGFKTSTGITPTTGQVKLKVVITKATQKQYRNRVIISCSNGSGWTSNDYPNRITAVMERNHLDIARRALILKHSVSKNMVKPGDTVEFTIDFMNSSEAGWINGGRPGVSFSFFQRAGNGIATMNTMGARLFHDAQEAYIDFGNYRISYFLYDEKNTCVAGQRGCTNGWSFTPTIVEGLEKSSLKLFHEMIVPGQDAKGKWNQRLIIQFSDPSAPDRKENLTTIDHHLSEYRGMRQRIHRGGTEPLRLVWYINSSSWTDVNWSNAWSWDPNASDDDGGIYYPVTNDWSDPDRPDIPVNYWNRKACATAKKTVDNILVEEWDGYTWRRVAGNGPMPGREVYNVVLSDTLSDAFTFIGFTESNPLGIAPKINGRVISWSVPRMQIGEGGAIIFKARVNGNCPDFPDRTVVNRAWISADKESAFADSAIILISCDTVIKPPSPDHIDIVTDTLVIDSTKDAEFVRITLDEGTQIATVYAVIRDRFGKICGKVSLPLWLSKDSSVSIVEGDGWKGTVIKKGAGSTVIVVSDRNNPSLKPDSFAVLALEAPPWPVISLAVMYDREKGDIIPDLLEIVLNDTFHINQRLDSVVIEYRGETYSYDRKQVNLNGNYITVPFESSRGIDPQPSGTVKLIMTVGEEKKYVSKDFIDGVGPAITSVWLGNNPTANIDTLRLTFSEDVVMQTLVGQTIQLIKNNGKDTILLTVLSFRGPEIYTQTEVIVVSSESGKRPEEGDLIRLVPGEKGGTLRDRRGNLPHLLNPAVKIPERPGQLIDGIYRDEDADGIIDAVRLTFSKDAGIDTMLVSLKWGSVEYYNAGSQYLSYGNNKRDVIFTLPPQFKEDCGIKTSGIMSVKVQFSLNETRIGQIQDSAAPVIMEAIYRIADQNIKFQTSPIDTLIVTFSEKVIVGTTTTPLLFKRGEILYSLQLQYYSTKNQTVYFLVKGIDGIEYPEEGDTLWINPSSAIGDSLTWQNNPLNRRALLHIMRGALPWDIIVVPNPFEPYNSVGDEFSTTIQIVNPVNPFLPVNLVDVKLFIYDQVGNIVAGPLKFEKTEKGPVCKWNGTNRKGRIVGTGTYIGIVTVSDNGKKEIKRIKIGVSKRK